MLITLPELKKSVAILGIRLVDPKKLPAALEEVSRHIPNVTIQVFDSNRVAGAEHLLLATINALSAFKGGRNISKKLAMEIMLYVAGDTQIDDAIKMCGFSEETTSVAAVIVSEDLEATVAAVDALPKFLNGYRDDSVLEGWTEAKLEALKSLYGISEEAIGAVLAPGLSVSDALRKLVIERGAVLPTKV